MSDVVKFVAKPMATMTEDELGAFAKKVLGEYATLEQLIEHSSEPPCPHHILDQVVTDIPSQTWGKLLRRIGVMLDINDMSIKRQPKAWRKDHSMGYYYRTDIFMAVHEHISKLVAVKARRARAAIRNEDISEAELEKILETSGIV